MIMARSFGSLSWFKHRTDYLNKAYGTSYSPKMLHSIYVHTGEMPPGFRELPDSRSLTPKKIKAYDEAFAGSLRTRFRQLGKASNYVQTVLDAIGGWVSPAGSRFYQEEGGVIYTKAPKRPGEFPNGWAPVRSVPKGAQHLTPRLAYELIRAKAKEIQEREKPNPSERYKSF